MRVTVGCCCLPGLGFPPGNQAASSKQTPKLPAFTLQDKQERTIRDTQCPALSFAVSGAVIMSVCNSTINY